ncbi:MAG TPA: glutamine-hydrolyzing carbamoyl-phosphate synthase small subunit [Gemmatimonadaceae bacterium]
MSTTNSEPGFLLLEDGTLFHGDVSGPFPPTVAEVVFTTNMTGYQEVFTDPSYRGQIVVMTTPMIGNYGVNHEDPESAAPQVAGVVVRELSNNPSNWRATGDLRSWLNDAQIPVLAEVDTRRLTRHLRSSGVMRGLMGVGEGPNAESAVELEGCPSMEGLDLASLVTTREPYTWGDPGAASHIVAYDFGVKRNSLRLLEQHGCRVTVVPADTPAAAVFAMKPDGVFLSNGPGDPAAVSYAPPIIREIAERGIPILGICLGHQLLAITYGGRTEKMPYGHHGGNHPVRSVETGAVLITSQNHGFTVAGTARDGEEVQVAGAPALQVTHVNLNDGTVEGLRHRELPVFAVQYHPEAAPGPHDARPLFNDFMDAVRSNSRSK